MNIAKNIERGAHLFPEKIAILFEGTSLHYKTLNEKVNRFANALKNLGIKKGDRVALFLPNIPHFAFAYLGIQKIGAIAVSMNVMLKAVEAEFILNDSGACAIVTTEETRCNVTEDKLPGLNHIFITEGQASGKDLLMDDVMENASPIFSAMEMDPHDPAAILYTSGTTGFPKGATLSHSNVITNMNSAMHNCGMKPEDRLHLCLPLFHCFGQNVIMNSGLNACATLVMERRFIPDQALKTIANTKVTIFFGVPTIFITYLNMKVSAENFKTVRYFFTAAATMPQEIATAWKETFGQKIYEGYGLTETSPFASYNHFFCHKHGSIGTPIENVEMKIVKKDGSQPAPGDWGEIAIKGPNVMLGYWNREEETKKVIKDGWFYSGDIGMTDEDGYFYICDRVKDMVIVSGFNVYPAEIENVLHSHPSVAEVAVYGMPDSVKGEVVKASVVLHKDQKITEADLVAYCRERMANYKVPRWIEFTSEIPKSQTGKILKRVLRHDKVVPS